METNEDIIAGLLVEFKNHRDAVMEMILDIETLKGKIDTLIPDSLDARYVRFFEEKVKTATEFFRTLLEMRKEIQKSLKDEIDIRRKVNVADKDVDIEDLINIRDLAGKVEDFKQKKISLQKKSVKVAQKETDEISIEVRKMNTGVMEQEEEKEVA